MQNRSFANGFDITGVVTGVVILNVNQILKILSCPNVCSII